MSGASPELSPIRLADLGEAFAQAGLPRPRAVAPFARPWRHVSWRVSVADGPDLLLREAADASGAGGLEREAAAHALARGVIPIAPLFRVLPAGGLDRPAAVTSLLPGRNGEEVMRRLPEMGPAVALGLGRVLRALSRARLPRFGLDVVAGRFTSPHGSWVEAWEARVADLARAARSCDMGPGPFVDRLLDAVTARLPSLDRAIEFTLVHGDLHPGNILFVPEESCAVSGVVDWEAAMVGDPLVDWALPTLVPTETLAHVVRGYGADPMRAVLDEDHALGRIEAYHRSHLLERLAFAAGALLRGDPLRRATAVEQARHLEAMDAHARIEAALTHVGEGRVQGIPHPSPRAALTRWALTALGDERIGLWQVLAALLATAGADDHERTAPTRWLRAYAPSVDAPPSPVRDRGRWRRALVEHVRSRGSRAEAAVAGATLAAGLAGLDRLSGDVGDGVLGALEARTRGALAGTWPSGPALEALRAYGAAELGLGTTAPPDPRGAPPPVVTAALEVAARFADRTPRI